MMDNVTLGGYVVRRVVNSCTSVFEYTLQKEIDQVRNNSVIKRSKTIPRSAMYKDLADYLKVNEIEGFNDFDENQTIIDSVGVREISVVVYEGKSVVICKCGVQADDGKKMLQCDFCQIWRHTHCHGYDDAKKPPPVFMCLVCRYKMVSHPRKKESSMNSIMEEFLFPTAGQTDDNTGG
ncbi:hypothetical protein OSB04_000708 [Centaurea solstitialis]|uniref:Zinc finger PHD-type domain-containing protein n=1 Tax=Centaurea solstitialis TaxID=347529 RepID=A0AA38WKZ4_9ASTR|nr:hypothetical protein OSB04_000708 [Centaurea solstitialis]